MKTAQFMKTTLQLCMASMLTIMLCRCTSSNNQNKKKISQGQTSSMSNQNQRSCEPGISDSTCLFLKYNQELHSQKFVF